MATIRLTDPDLETLIPMSLIKEFCRIDNDLDNSCSEILIDARSGAVSAGEHRTHIIWGQADFEFRWNILHGLTVESSVKFPITPVQSVKEVKLFSVDNTETVLTAADYNFQKSSIEFGHSFAELRLITPPPAGTVDLRVQAVVGWDGETFPRDLKMWALNRIASLYDVRGDIQDLGGKTFVKMPRDHTDSLLDKWIVYGHPRHCI